MGGSKGAKTKSRKRKAKSSRKSKKRKKIHVLDGNVGLTEQQQLNRERLEIAYEELRKRVTHHKQVEQTERNVDDELRYMEDKFRQFKQRRRQQKMEKEKSRKQVQKTREHVFNLRKQLEKEKDEDRKKLEKMHREKKKLAKHSKIVGNRHGKLSSKYDMSRLQPHLHKIGEVLQKYYNLPRIAQFAHPVDTLTYPHYLRVIQRPMCLDKVREKLFSGVYRDENDFVKDVMQIWVNAQIFNPAHNQVHLWAAEFQHTFERDCLSRGWTIPKRSELMKHTIREKPKPAVQRKLTTHELNLIENHFPQLPEDKIDAIIEKLPVGDNDEEEVTIDIQSLSKELQWQIFRIIKDHFKFDAKILKGETIRSFNVNDSKATPPAPHALWSQNPVSANPAPEKPKNVSSGKNAAPVKVQDVDDIFSHDLDIPEDSVFNLPKVPTPKKIPKHSATEVDDLVDESDSEDSGGVKALDLAFFKETSDVGPTKANSLPPTPRGHIPQNKWDVETSEETTNKLQKEEFWKKFNKENEKEEPEEEIVEVQVEEGVVGQSSEEFTKKIKEESKLPVLPEPIKPPELIQPEVNLYAQNDLMKDLDDLF